ncbi:hypothetical protein N7478_000263 [Penicillium angulare]|uniref:uncharacterized protein n=1 Tax=Penicillium angulare TaxID=116970 RepID=UPI00253FF3A0|nr:uncharacterized protein N7478_000263 [Penicillium angulare]KAJ5291012.1 hypothetical protein N7478_000263 [Penicillium angulare]
MSNMNRRELSTVSIANQRLAKLSFSMTGPQNDKLDLDAAIVGAGFSGIQMLHHLRDQLNLNVKIIDSGSSVGGTWHWNNYPGARVDSPVPTYGFDIEEVWKTWDWSEKYPAQQELGAYFAHADRVLSISKDCIFNTEVTGASFDGERWNIITNTGKAIRAKYLIPAVGFAGEYTPQWKGIDTFKGDIYRPWFWPREKVDVKGKRVAVIGTGPTGVQIIQEWAKDAAETFVFQRTPNIAFPMRQKKLDKKAQDELKAETANLFAICRTSATGFPWQSPTKPFADYSPEEVEAILSSVYDEGGLKYWTGGWSGLLVEPTGNRAAYDFWAMKTRSRIQDPVKRDLLAPLEPLHPLGVKRPSLEQDYYEQMDKSNVHLINTRAHPVVELTPTGIMTDDNVLHEVDVIAVATGYNATTGSLARMGIKDVNGVDIGERWKDGVTTFLGMMVPGFPNMFLPFGAHAPTAFSNGPTCIRMQAEFIRNLVKKTETEGHQSVDASPQAAQAWTAQIHAIADRTLVTQADSWYMGANIPGKHREFLYFIAGLRAYRHFCGEAMGAKFDDSFVFQS